MKGNNMPSRIEIVSSTDNPLELCASTARTCYSASPVRPKDLPVSGKDLSEFCMMLFKAGHHTVFQHPQYTFLITGVSRYLVWDLLHNHEFYNSEQTSQRYTYTKIDAFSAYIPDSDDETGALFVSRFDKAMSTYDRLVELLVESGRKKKQAQEDARYILPVATFTNLYHTVNLMTVFRLYSKKFSCECSSEELGFLDELRTIVEERNPELRPFFDEIDANAASSFVRDFDFDLDEKAQQVAFCSLFTGQKTTSMMKTHDFGNRMDAAFSKAARSIGDGSTAAGAMLRKDCISYALRESVMSGRERSPFPGLSYSAKDGSSVLGCTNLTFVNRVSFASDCQEQRHRTIRQVRPKLSNTVMSYIDNKYYIPLNIRKNPKAFELYRSYLDGVYMEIDFMKDSGKTDEWFYLIPNAHRYFTVESGTLGAFQMKMNARLCGAAQEETRILNGIQFSLFRDACMDENVDYFRYFGPPCAFRKKLGLDPICPEGSRSCGRQK